MNLQPGGAELWLPGVAIMCGEAGLEPGPEGAGEVYMPPYIPVRGIKGSGRETRTLPSPRLPFHSRTS